MGDIGDPGRRVEIVPANDPVLPRQPDPVQVPEREPAPSR